MKRPSKLNTGHLLLLSCGLAIAPIGCGADKTSDASPEVVKNQQSASEAWAKVKADGSAKARAIQSTRQRPTNTRGHANGS